MEGASDAKRRRTEHQAVEKTSLKQKQDALEAVQLMLAELDKGGAPVKLLERLAYLESLTDPSNEDLKRVWAGLEGTRGNLELAIENLYQAISKLDRLLKTQQPIPSDPKSIENIVAYAHRLTYTTHAPPNFIPGQTQLHLFKPPAPQEGQLRSSILHTFQREHETKVQAAKQTAAYAAPVAPAVVSAPEPAPLDIALQKMPPMPAGWKPGDPIPGLPAVPVAKTPQAEEGIAAAEVAAVPAIKPAPAAPKPFSAAFNFALNPDLADVEMVFGAAGDSDDDDDDTDSSSDED